MTAQQTAAKERKQRPVTVQDVADIMELGRRAERLAIRRALLALYVDARSVWLYRESVVAAIKKATRKGRR